MAWGPRQCQPPIVAGGGVLQNRLITATRGSCVQAGRDLSAWRRTHGGTSKQPQEHATSSIITPLQFPQVPLVSGDTVISEHGENHARTIQVVVTCEDGHEHRFPLSYAYGGWRMAPEAV